MKLEDNKEAEAEELAKAQAEAEAKELAEEEAETEAKEADTWQDRADWSPDEVEVFESDTDRENWFEENAGGKDD